jgi:O-antigen/teichoic acid export membrane protein
MSVDFGNKRISRNVAATVTQVLISGVVFFVLYRYLYDRLGIEQIGVWSLVLAATSVSRIGDLGLSAGVVRFVAQALGRGDTLRAADVVQTVALTLGLFMGALLAVGYPLFILALKHFFTVHDIPIALSILPYALISLWVMVIVSVFSGGLDGCMRMDLRSLLMGLSHLAYLGLAMLLVPKYGLEGVAMAQLIQSVGLMFLLWCMLRQQLRELPLIPIRWKISVLKGMIGYGVNFQIITVMNMLFDPMVKVLMSKFGGLDALGYYEMANKLILQGRAIIVEASRVMVPAIATLQEHDATQATQLFMTSYRMTFYVAVLFFGLLGMSITTISLLWLGHYQATFIQFALLLNLGWFANTLIGPAYFSNLGSGKLRANMISHIIMALCSLFIGVTLGLNYGGIGVVIGTITGLIAGSLFLLITHIKQADLHWLSFIIPKNMSKLLMLGIFAIFSSAYYGREHQSSLIEVTGIAVLCYLPLLMFGWFNPARMMLKSYVKFSG